MNKLIKISIVAILALTTLQADHLEQCTVVCDENSNFESEAARQCAYDVADDDSIFFQLKGCEILPSGEYLDELPDGEPEFKDVSFEDELAFDIKKARDEGIPGDEGEAESDSRFYAMYPVPAPAPAEKQGTYLTIASK